MAVAGMYSVYGPAYSLPSELLTGSAVAAGLGLTSSIANAAGFVGPYAAGWISQITGSFYAGPVAGRFLPFFSGRLASGLPAKTGRKTRTSVGRSIPWFQHR